VNRPKKVQNLLKLRFLTSAVDAEGCPEDSCPEIAIVGRSNAGKSTLINGISGSKIAQVSSTPGKTRLLNFYQSPAYRLVDMPGYGFAARPEKEKQIWTRMIESFLATRRNLTGLVIVMDIRREWTDDESNLLDWMAPRKLPVIVALTKADKLSPKTTADRRELIMNDSGLSGVLVTSSLKKQGFVELEEYMFRSLVQRKTDMAGES
jgi:GTP-binding protein